MKQYFIYFLILATILSCSAVDRSPRPEIEARIPDEGKIAEFDFEYVNNAIILPVTINGETRKWFLDNGAVSSYIDSNYAAELSFPLISQRPVVGIVNIEKAFEVLIPEYKIGQLAIQNVTAGCMNFDESFFKNFGENIYGVVGTDFLAEYIVRIDIANRKLTFFDPDKFVYHGNGQIFEHTAFFVVHFIKAIIDGVYEGAFMIDFGSSIFALYNKYALDHEIDTGTGIATHAQDAVGKIDTKITGFNKLEIGDFQIDKPIVTIFNSGGGASSLFNFAGDMGTPVLQNFVVYLDYKLGRLIFEKGNDFNRQFPSGFFGLGLSYAEDYMYVEYVVDNSPAIWAGFKSGDIIRKFEGRTLSSLQDTRDMKETLKKGAGKTFTLTVERDGKLLDLELTPVDIYDLF